MTKQLWFAAALVLAVGCKTDDARKPKPADPPVRSAKIDVKPTLEKPDAPSPEEQAAAIAAATDNPYGTEDGLPASYPVVPNTIVPETRHPEFLRDPDELGGRNVWRKRRKLDLNRDGVVDDDERDTAIFSRLTATHSRLDANGDGTLSADELSSAPGRMRFDNAAALDTDRNGDISPDELAAGFKARRERRAAGIEPPPKPEGPAAPPLPIEQQPVLPPPQ